MQCFVPPRLRIELNSRLDNNNNNNNDIIEYKKNTERSPSKKKFCLKNDWRERERERERIEYRVFNEITRIDVLLLLPPSFFSNQVSPPIEFFNARILGEKRSSSRPASQLSPPFVTSSSLGMLNPISWSRIQPINVGKCSASLLPPR